MGLCFRCEFRARYLEKKQEVGEATAPRFECHMVEQSVHSCYMFRPVKPLVIEKNDSEKQLPIDRPIGGGMIGSRIHAVKEQPEEEEWDFEIKSYKIGTYLMQYKLKE